MLAGERGRDEICANYWGGGVWGGARTEDTIRERQSRKDWGHLRGARTLEEDRCPLMVSYQTQAHRVLRLGPSPCSSGGAWTG